MHRRALRSTLLAGVRPGPAAMLAALVAAVFAAASASAQEAQPDAADPQAESALLTGVRQLTFAGKRSGEGYFSAAGDQLVFQSEREAGNPFFQIYLLDLTTGDQRRISPGRGKTTCSWLHPDGRKVLFASTHGDAEAIAKQEAELEFRASGQSRRYSWDYDPEFELYAYDLDDDSISQLTDARGYDAEGSYSPDGSLIAFASNRAAYDRELTDREALQLERDPAYFMDLYIMNADGGEPRRLTDEPGYDGGPFFSPDGSRICWRRFSPDGATAEIFTAKLDGSDVRQLTKLGAMSWAPYYHPSGDYLIFATNLQGFGNFELYLVDAAGKRDPVRVTYTDGFDGLPAFSPDGASLAWTSSRTSGGDSQIFLASWNDAAARELLRLDETDAPAEEDLAAAETSAAEAAAAAEAKIQPQDLLRHVDYLCRPELEGRLTGTRGERLATAYVAGYFKQLGLEPAGDDGTYFHEFEFTSGVELGDDCRLSAGDREYAVDADWRPVGFSAEGEVAPAPVVWAGYGIVAPADGEQAEYDSYVHLDVERKWVLALRYLPEDVSPERRQHLARHASLRYKAMVARDRGAAGLIVVSGPTSGVNDQLVPLALDGSLSGTSLPVISVTDEIAAAWLSGADADLGELAKELDSGEPAMGFPIEALEVSADIDVTAIKKTGRNVLARLSAAEPSGETVLIGAHVDHLGRGGGGSSLARGEEEGQIHFGADDNASGVAAVLEAAEFLASEARSGRFRPKRDILFAAWSGEELGLIGSARFAEDLAAAAALGGHGDAAGTLYPAIAACLNLDMVGRLDKSLVLQGFGSSTAWPALVEQINAVVGLPLTTQDDSYLPTDASTFFLRGVPILSAFTGSHGEYHTPRDTPDRLNYEGAAQVARFMALAARRLALADDAPEYVQQQRPENEQPRAALRAYLGTIPDYASEGVAGVKLSGVAAGGPAETGGLQAGDVIIELAGRKIENIYDYTYAIEAIKIGQPVKIVVNRAGEQVEMEVTPGSRE